MKNMISIFIILITSIMLSGCSEVNNVSVNEDYALAKKIAKEDLSEEQKKKQLHLGEMSQ